MTAIVAGNRWTFAPITYVQAGLALVAATIFGWRAARTANGQGMPEVDSTSHVLGALAVGATAGLAVAAAVLILTDRRRAALAALGAALGMELAILGGVAAPPRLIAALPLGLAMTLFIRSRPAHGASAPRTAAAVAALLVMLPVGFQYLVSGLVVPGPDVFGMYALFALLLAGAVLLARRRSWWVLAMPPLASGLWFLLISLGGEYWGWQP